MNPCLLLPHQTNSAGPSPADTSFANDNNLPGVLRVRSDGYIWFGPALPQ